MPDRDAPASGEEKTSQKENRPPLTYAAAGVDIDAKTELMKRLVPLFRSTFTPQVDSDIGAFGGLFSVKDLPYSDPVLVASTDSVGTKVRIANMARRHHGIGIDIVAHCVNDIVCQGATSLFFLDYFATGKLEPEIMQSVVEGLVEACRKAECALIGGETAELPGFYQPGDYDLVGFVVGVVERSGRILGDLVQPGDALIGLASDGLHTNGYSLARKLFFEVERMTTETSLPELGHTLGEELLRPHRIYAPAILQLIKECDIRGIAHITGGGLPDNLPRCLPAGCRAIIERQAWQVPPIFQIMQGLGDISDEEMFRTFNMGVGAVLVLPESQAQDACARLRQLGETPFIVGRIESGERGVAIV